MDKKLILAVAGSGKTTKIVEEINDGRRFLILTYTEANLKNLRQRVVAAIGHLPSNVVVMSYLTFLYSFCAQPLIGLKHKSKGINFEYRELPSPGRFNQSQDQYYLDPNGRFYVGRLAKFISLRHFDGVIERLERFFDVLCVDEVQDFASHDFDLLLKLARANVAMLLVGDFWQHTYDTSRDGGTNKSLYDDYGRYLTTFRKAGFLVDTESLSKSHRCSPEVCSFINSNLGISIESGGARNAQVIPVDAKESALAILYSPEVVKLFYKEHYKYNCYSQNWGASKGEDHYDEVCVVLNATTLKLYKRGELHNLPAATRNKLYVALSRSRGNVYLVPYTLLDDKG